jgi:hypothetical protein
MRHKLKKCGPNRFMQMAGERSPQSTNGNQLHDVGEILVGPSEIALPAGNLLFDQSSQGKCRESFQLSDRARVAGIGEIELSAAPRAFTGEKNCIGTPSGPENSLRRASQT